MGEIGKLKVKIVELLGERKKEEANKLIRDFKAGKGVPSEKKVKKTKRKKKK